jgi:NADH:ubiquinone reductase (H+-translocating)
MKRTDPGPSPRVVILGAGFGGLAAAKALANSPLDVTIVDQHNYHLFQPLLYQVATAGLSPADIASPIRSIMRDAHNVSVVLAKVGGIDVNRREVVAESRRIPFDYLIVATGAKHAYSATTNGRLQRPASRRSTMPPVCAVASCSRSKRRKPRPIRRNAPSF